MNAKSKQCDECEHFDRSWSAQVTKRVCHMKHKPRFYYAQLDKAGRIPGWKRRCEDFKKKEDE